VKDRNDRSELWWILLGASLSSARHLEQVRGRLKLASAPAALQEPLGAVLEGSGEKFRVWLDKQSVPVSLGDAQASKSVLTVILERLHLDQMQSLLEQRLSEFRMNHWSSTEDLRRLHGDLARMIEEVNQA
jgi:hypothetical protein